ncbi:hypothetical protein ACS0TY_026296 [Phlomoides rotata]
MVFLQNFNANSNEWRVTGCYSFPSRSDRNNSWSLLRNLASSCSFFWVCIGDYNDLLNPGDRGSRVDHPNWFFSGFTAAVDACQLTNLPLIGCQFTWFKTKGSRNVVKERLDRAMVTPSWMDLCPNEKLLNLVAPVSDHNPIMVDTSPTPFVARYRPFRFENKWLEEPDLKSVIDKC